MATTRPYRATTPGENHFVPPQPRGEVSPTRLLPPHAAAVCSRWAACEQSARIGEFGVYDLHVNGSDCMLHTARQPANVYLREYEVEQQGW